MTFSQRWLWYQTSPSTSTATMPTGSTADSALEYPLRRRVPLVARHGVVLVSLGLSRPAIGDGEVAGDSRGGWLADPATARLSLGN